MALDIRRVQHVPTYADAVRVTLANMAEVAAWCGGQVKVHYRGTEKKTYVKVPVVKPVNETRDTQAYAGYYVIKTTGQGFKVYHPKAYDRFFVPSDVMAEEEYLKMVQENST